jgi:hypothetical protein
MEVIQQYIIYAMAGVIVFLSAYGFIEHTAKEECQLNSKVASELARQEMAQLEARMKTYDKDVLAITQFYDFELSKITDFKKDDNETECDASFRMLRGFKF